MLNLRRPPLVLLITASMFLFPGPGCDALESDGPVETHDDSFTVSDAVTIDVDNTNGRVTVTGEDTNTVRVQARLRQADRIDYDARQFGNSIQVTASRNGSRFGQSPVADIEITAPSNAVLVLVTQNGALEVRNFTAGADLRTSNGRITVEGMSGSLEADTSNGPIEVSGHTGSAMLETSNGRITYSGRLVAGSENEMRTSNGSVSVDLDGEPGIELDASTSNGSVSTDFPITIGSSGDNHLEGTIGDGAARLIIRTSNGSIAVR